MKRFLMIAGVLTLALALLAPLGCGKDEVAAPSSGLSAEEQARLEAERQRRLREARLKEDEARASQLREVFVNQDIHFEYDRWDLSSEAKQVLNEKAEYMRANPQLMVIVEGHCDERGSNSYNMALGEKRSKAAAAYLEAMGVAPNRLETVSYGEERPLVLGVSEEAYAANRRAHFVIK